MKKDPLLTTLLLIVFLAILAACTVPLPGIDTGGSVTFIVPIDAAMFSEATSLRFRLWHTDQLEIMEGTGDCTVSYNAETGSEEILCPDGVVYQVVSPEEFIIPVGDISDFAIIESSEIRVGQWYRLQITGLSADNCNNASASIEAVAKGSEITLGDLAWMTTMMACP